MTNTKFQFEELIKQELFDAELKYPDYHSFHEGYAVLKEEVEELHEEVNYLVCKMNDYWRHIRQNKVDSNDIDTMKKVVINILKEAVQIGSILKRHEKLFNKKY
jgi:hypothetical protein